MKPRIDQLAQSGATDGQAPVWDNALGKWVPSALFTAEQARDAIAAALVAGSNITIDVDDAGDTITINGVVTSYTDEMARDAIGAALAGGTGISIAVDDAGNTITITSTVTQYTDEMARDAIGAALVAGTGIGVAVNDAGDTITLSSTVAAYTDEMVRDVIGAALVAGSGIGILVDDSGDTITLSATGTAGSVNSVSAGFPSFTGRSQGDHHYNLTTLRDYVLTGVAAAGGTDDFTATNGTAIGGRNTTTADKTWSVVGNGSATIQSNQADLVPSNSGTTIVVAELDLVGLPLYFQATIPSSTAYGGIGINLDTTGGVYSHGLFLRLDPGGGHWDLFEDGNGPLASGSLTAGSHILRLEYASGSVTVIIDGVSKYTAARTLTRYYAGLVATYSSGTTHLYADSIAYSTTDTRAWSRTEPPEELVSTVNSGSAVTLVAPSSATVHRVTLNAATPVITLPAPDDGVTIEVDVIQDGTGGRVPSWATPSGTIKWAGGSAPTITSTAGKQDVLQFRSRGGNWLGMVVSQNH